MKPSKSLLAPVLCFWLLFLGSCTTKKAPVESGPAPAQFKVDMKTTKGAVVILVHRDWSPLVADLFY